MRKFDIYSNPLDRGQSSDQAPAPQQGPSEEEQRDQLLNLFDSYERQGYTAQQMVNSAVIQGFDRDLVNGEMYIKIEDAKKKQEEQYQQYLKDLRAAKQKQVNMRARMNAMEGLEQSDPDVVIDADNNFFNASKNLRLLKQAKLDLQSEDVSPGAENRYETLLQSLGYDPAGYQKDIEDSPQAVSNPLQDMMLKFFSSSAAERTPEQTQSTLSAIDAAIENEKRNLEAATTRQNQINRSLGFNTNFDPRSDSDMRILEAEVSERNGFEEAFERGQEDYNSVDYIPVVTPFVGTIASWATQGLIDIGTYANALTFQDKGADRWLARANANVQGFNDQMSRDIGVSEANRGKDTFEVLFDDSESLGQKFLKVSDFAIKLFPEAAAQVATLGGKTITKKGAKSFASRYLTTSNVYLASLGLKSAGSFRRQLDERDDLTSTEKNLMATIVGGSELALARMFRASEQLAGRAFMRPPKRVAEAAMKSKNAALKNIDYGRIGWGEVGKSSIFEAFEEGLQSTIQENIENVYDFANGVKPRKEVNYYAIADGFLGGLMMGGGMSSVGKLSSNIGHSKVKESIELQKQVIRAIESQIDSVTNPEERSRLRTTLLQEQDRLFRLHSIGNAFYDRLEDGDKKKIIQLNQKLSDIRDQIQSSKGKEKESLISQFESLYAQKSAIESKVIKENELAELSKDRPSTNQLMGLIEESAEAVQVSREQEAELEAINKSDDDAVGFSNQEVADQVYSLLDSAQTARERGDVRTYGKLRQQARRLANASGIDGMDFVNLLDKYEKGERIPFVEGRQAEQATGQQFKDDSIELSLTPGQTLEQGGANTSVPTSVISKLNSIVKGFAQRFGDGKVTARYHRTQESLYAVNDRSRKDGISELANPEDGVTFGFFEPDGRGGGTLHIGPNFDAVGQDVTSEEALHFVLEPLLKSDDQARKDLFDTLLEMAGLEYVDGKMNVIEGAEFNAAAREVVLERERFYADDTTLAEFEEEVVMGFIIDYSQRPSVYRARDNRNALQKFIDFLSNMFSRGGNVEGNVISNADDLLTLAEKVSRGLRGQETEIMGKYNSELESTRRARGQAKKPFDYLKDTVVYYRENLSEEVGEDIGVLKSIKVKDYFHFRNWYNYMTANQTKPGRVIQPYYIVEVDGVQEGRFIKTPKPKLDRNNKPVFMRGPKLRGQATQAQRPNLDNVTITFTQVFEDATPGGRGRQRSRTRQVTVNDYNNYRNLYIKLTGNGASTNNMRGMTYEKDGEVVRLDPPPLRTDGQGNIVEMRPQRIEGFTSRTIRLREESQEANRQALRDLREKNDVLREEFRKSVVKGFARSESFFPIEILRQQEETGQTIARILTPRQRLVATDRAIANLRALNESDITVEDIRERGGSLSPEENQDIFNMAEPGGEANIDKLVDGDTNEVVEGGESVRQLDGVEPATTEDLKENRGVRRARGEKVQSDEEIISDFMSRREKNYGTKASDKTLVSDNVIVNVEDLPYEVTSISNLQDAPWMMVSYDALGAATINIYGKEYKLDSGVADVFKVQQAGGTLSLSHADNSKRKSTLTALRKLKENGHSRVHVFVNTNNAENAFKNPKLFSTMVNSLMDRIFSKSVLEGKGQYKPSMNQAQARQMMVDGLTQVKFRGKTGLDLIVNSNYYKSLTDAQKKNLGMNPDTNQFVSVKGRTVEQIRNLYDILLLNPEGVNEDHQRDLTSFDFREKLASKLELLDRSGKRRKFGKKKTHTIDIGTLSDLEYQALAIDPSMKTTDENGDTTPFDAGTVGFVMTINIDQALSEDGQFEDFTKAFPFQVGGLEGLFKLDNNYTVQALLGISPSQAAQLIMTREFEPTEDVESRRQDFVSTERERLMQEFEEKMSAAERATTDVSSQRRARGVLKNNVKADPSTWTLGEKSASENFLSLFKQKIVDKYQGILDLQSEIEKSRGFATRKEEDFRMAEELMYGKAAEDLKKLEKRVDAITEIMKEEGLTQKDVSDFLYALHVPERNRVIEERNKTKNGSGQTNEQAQKTLSRLSPKRQALNKVEKLIRQIQDDTRKAYVESSSESQETIDAFESMFEFYVPLAGLSTDESVATRSPYPTASSLSITDPSTKRAEGRETEAENILAQIISQNAQAHINGRTNEVMNTLYNLVQNNPNPNVWTIVDNADPTDGHVVGVRVNGEQKFVRFRDASYAETLRGMGVAKQNMFLKVLSVPNKWLRASFTTLNPEFVISNFLRDIQSAIFNAAAEAEIEGGMLNGEGIVADILSNSVPALKALLKDRVGRDMPPVIGKYFQEFKEDGGKTGWAYTKRLQDYASEIDKAVSKNGRTPAQKIFGKVKDFGKAVEGINDAFENSIRLSAYISARENGVSREKAAQLAKNITVNFNKHGEYGQALNSVYLFFNASVQGTARLGRSLLTAKPATRPDGSKREWYERVNNAQKMAAGLALFNAMITMLNRALSDEDEDGVLFYDKIPDYVKERNVIMMYDGKNYITIPMPYGFNVFANVGSASVDVTQGGRDIDESLVFLGSSLMSSFVPIGFGQSRDLYTHTVKAFTPTVFKPIIEINNNETHFGGQIFMEALPYGTPRPNSEMSFNSPRAVQNLFRWVNQASGGTEERSGSIDMNPDKAWYLFEYFLGGAGQFITRAGETTFKLVRKETDTPDLDLAFNDIPLLRKLYGEPSKFYDFQKFKENSVDIKQLSREMKNKNARRTEKGYYSGVARLDELLNAYNQQLKQLRKKRQDAKKIESFPERTARVQEIRDKERKIVMKFNAAYERLRGQKD